MTTQFATASYQEIIDINTEADKTSIIGIHTPNDAKPVNMLKGFWEQFRQFRYDGCSIQLVPAARLPADISQVGYGAGEPPIDMRDILNPIMFKGCHGNDMGVILNSILNDDEKLGDSCVRGDSPYTGFDPYESLYYRALTDNTWKKANPQVGFKKSGLVPLVHNVVTNVAFGQYAPGYLSNGDPFASFLAPSYLGQLGNSPIEGTFYSAGTPELNPGVGSDGNINDNEVSLNPTQGNISFFTNRLTRMSWQDTHSALMFDVVTQEVPADSVNSATMGAAVNQVFRDVNADITNRCNTVPLAYMGVLLLPPAYKTEQYFRMIINHRFSFRRFRGVSMAPTPTNIEYSSDPTGLLDINGGYYNENE